MDSLGIDENGSPFIFEYKRASNENVINQGLFYLDWLMDHEQTSSSSFSSTSGQRQPGKLDWSNPRLVCVAGDFNRYDEHAVAQINHPSSRSATGTTASACSPSARSDCRGGRGNRQRGSSASKRHTGEDRGAVLRAVAAGLEGSVRGCRSLHRRVG